jgi:hypothetical protein
MYPGTRGTIIKKNSWPLAKTSSGLMLSLMPVSTKAGTAVPTSLFGILLVKALGIATVQGCYQSYMNNPTEGFMSVYDGKSNSFPFLFPREGSYSFS